MASLFFLFYQIGWEAMVSVIYRKILHLFIPRIFCFARVYSGNTQFVWYRCTYILSYVTCKYMFITFRFYNIPAQTFSNYFNPKNSMTSVLIFLLFDSYFINFFAVFVLVIYSVKSQVFWFFALFFSFYFITLYIIVQSCIFLLFIN